MSACPTLQYSWHGMRCSPGLSNRVRTSATNPGTTMVFTLVPAMRNPCTTSGLVTRNTTRVSAGTTMHCGTKEYCCASTRTIADPSARIAVPRLASMNSPARWRRLASIVSTFEGGWAAQCRPVKMITANRKTTTSATTRAHRRSDGSTPSMEGAFALSVNDASRQEHEHEEGDPDREHRGHRQAGQRQGAAGPRGDDLLDLLLVAEERDVLRAKRGRHM